jgi:hypothetical protein
MEKRAGPVASAASNKKSLIHHQALVSILSCSVKRSKDFYLLGEWSMEPAQVLSNHLVLALSRTTSLFSS